MLERLKLLGQYARLVPKALKYKPDGTTTVADLLDEQVGRFAEKPFIHFGERGLTYGELDARANRVAHWAHENGLRKGDVVALLMENRPEYVPVWAGLAKVGVTTALINTNLTGAALRHAFATSRADHLILGSECVDRFATTAHDLERPLGVWIDRDPEKDGGTPEGARDFGDALDKASSEKPDPEWRAGLKTSDDLFYIYTSGTTGLPKAARFSHLRFLQIGILEAHALELGPTDVSYCALPLYHTAGGVMLISGAIASGASVALRRKFSASHFWDDCRKYGATTFQYIGEFCRYLVNQPPRANDRDHRVRVAIGNGLRPDIWPEFQNRFGIPRIVEFYGATEGNAAIINLENKVGSVGRVPFRLLTNARLVRYDVEKDTYVRDERGFCIECKPGEVGEFVGLIPRSKNVPQGHFEGYTSEKDTEKKILRDVFRKGDAWFRSGDLLRQDEEGFFYFVDRIGDTFRWKGENVSTQEVAEALSGYPGLEMVNVYGVAVEGRDGRAGMAALLFREGESFDPERFFAYVTDRLPRYAAPLFVRILEEIELTGTLKIRKVTLQREGIDVRSISDPVWFRDDEAGAYVRLTPELADAIHAGERKI